MDGCKYLRLGKRYLKQEEPSCENWSAEKIEKELFLVIPDERYKREFTHRVFLDELFFGANFQSCIEWMKLEKYKYILAGLLSGYSVLDDVFEFKKRS